VEGIVYADDRLMRSLRDDPALQQVANVATLPGIVGASLAMPDVHWGYGFPVGGVAATAVDGGVVSPGGIGFDINCGVRVLRTDLAADEIRGALGRLADALFAAVPSGVGARGGHRLRRDELDDVLRDGARWAVGRGYGWDDDLDRTEEEGRLEGADPGAVSQRAHDRGADQVGTLGSGNHFLEVEVVDEIHDAEAASAYGLRPGQVVVAIHCGSRGLGHQVCTDHVAGMDRSMARHGIVVPDRQLACAPLDSGEARAYLGAMAAASNFAWANRQVIAHRVRGAFERVLGRSAESIGMRLVYDLSHNIAKMERHRVGGREIDVCVHRKGATRAFPAGHRVRLALSTSYWPIVWPSPAPVTVTIFAGVSVLTLPERPPRTADAALAPFGAPEGATPPAMTTLAPESGCGGWHYDDATGIAEMAADYDSGLERFDATGIAAGMRISERYRIAADDPLSATAALAWTIRRERGNWRVRVEAKIELRSTGHAFLVRQSLAAFEGDTPVFARDWDREIARDLV